MTDEDTSRISVVLDTNVFVAAYWVPTSHSAQLIQACKKKLIRAHYSPEVRREIEGILRMIKAREAFLKSLEDFWTAAEQVRGIPVEEIDNLADPDDRKFLEAAAGGESDLLVTNDQHLLCLKSVRKTQIVTPKSAIKIIGLEA